MNPRPVTVLVLCWNRWELTERCLETIRANTDLSHVEVLVVDNGSTDATPARLREYPWLRVVTNATNLGYVRGNNAGLAVASPASDVVLLNNDVEVLQPDWIDRLQATAHAARDVGVVGCRLRLPDGRLLHAGTYITPETCWGQQIGALEPDVNQFAADREVEGIVFACAYLKRETIQAIGGLSEAFQSYFEDTDYCLRAREAGFRTVLCGGVTLIHHEHGSTADDPELFDSIFQKSRSEFRHRWKSKLESRYRYPVHFQSVTNFAHGYATTCREMLRNLDDLGVLVSYSYVYGKGTPVPREEPENSGDYRINVIRGRRHDRHPEISVVYGQGDVFARNRGRYKVGYTMLEVDGFPAEWIRQANLMDEVWVPTRFNRDALVRGGVIKPVHVMPLGVDVHRFHPGIRSFPNPNGDFVFLANFEWGERKAPGLHLKVFNDTFKRSDPVVLVCKVINRDGGVHLRREVEALGLKDSGGRIAFLHNRELPYQELAALYRSADCVLSAGHGEGWDMPLMEAMACGLPTIATDWGAHWEFLNERISYPLRVRGTIPAVAKCPYYDGFSWADPDPGHLSALLRHVFENQEEAREVGRRAAREVAARWTTRRTAERIKDRLDEIARTRHVGHPPARAAAPARPERQRVAIDVSRAIGAQVSGVGRYALNLVRGLAAHGPADLDFLLLPGLGTFVHPEYGRVHTFRGPDAPNVTVYDGPLPAFSKGGGAPRADLVHSTAYMAPETDAPLLVTVHDLTFLTHPEHHTDENVRFCTTNLERAVARGASFVAVSESTRRELLARTRVEPSRVTVVPNTFDETLFHPYGAARLEAVRVRHGLPRRFLLFLASLEPRKNLATVLEALDRVDVGLPLVVAGASGWLNTPLDAALRKAGDKALRIGYVDQMDLGALYAAATALVYPSLHEGFGLPVLEAMACGTPVLTSNVSSLPEVAGDAALLLDDPLDAAAMGAALARLAGDGAERERLGAAGLERARLFSTERVTALLVDLYRARMGKAVGRAA